MDPFTTASAELRAVSTSTEQMRDMLERMHHDELSRAADLGRTLERLTTMIERVNNHLSRFDDVLRDMRLTMTGIGSIAKSLTEKQQGHEDILRAVKDILVHLTAKEIPPC